jgi:putative flippase GtrA
MKNFLSTGKRAVAVQLRKQSDTLARLCRFVIIGIMATCSHATITIVLMEWVGLTSAATANAAGAVTGITISYAGNWAWTFGGDARHGHYLPRFLIVYAVITGVNWAVMYIVADLWQVAYLIPLLFLFILSPIVTFTLNLVFVFRRRQDSLSGA